MFVVGATYQTLLRNHICFTKHRLVLHLFITQRLTSCMVSRLLKLNVGGVPTLTLFSREALYLKYSLKFQISKDFANLRFLSKQY